MLRDSNVILSWLEILWRRLELELLPSEINENSVLAVNEWILSEVKTEMVFISSLSKLTTPIDLLELKSIWWQINRVGL
jgi:hypothetical protein